MNLAHRFRSGKKELKEALRDGKKVLFVIFAVLLGVFSFIAGRKFVHFVASQPSVYVEKKVTPEKPQKPAPDRAKPEPKHEALNTTASQKPSENATASQNKTVEKKPSLSKTPLIDVAQGHLELLEKELSEIDLVEKATEAFRAGNYAEAIRLYEKALRINPANRKVLLNLASIYLQVGKKRRARKLFERLLKLDPRNTDALNNLGVMEMERGHYKKALSLFEKVLDVDPTNKAALINKAICLKRLGRADEAAKVYLYGMKLYPDEYRFYLYLGIYFYEKGQTEVAYRFLDQAYRLIPDKNSNVAAMLRRLLER